MTTKTPVEPGRFTELAELQHVTRTQSASGQHTPTWETIASVWLGFQAQTSSAGESTLAGQVKSPLRIMVRLYQRDDVFANQRFRLSDGRVLSILGVFNRFVGDGEMTVLCVEAAHDG